MRLKITATIGFVLHHPTPHINRRWQCVQVCAKLAYLHALPLYVKPMESITNFTDQRFAALLECGLRELKLELNPHQQAIIIAHLHLLSVWNKSYNLTAITDPVQMLNHHVFDSLSITPWLRGEHILDLGSGAGFPGVPLAIAEPHRQFQLLDSVAKKIRFLQYFLAVNPVANLQAEHGRVEHLRPILKFSTVVARAVGSLYQLTIMSQRVAAKDAIIIAMKGQYPHREIDELTARLPVAVEVTPLQVPTLNKTRHIAIISRLP